MNGHWPKTLTLLPSHRCCLPFEYFPHILLVNQNFKAGSVLHLKLSIRAFLTYPFVLSLYLYFYLPSLLYWFSLLFTSSFRTKPLPSMTSLFTPSHLPPFISEHICTDVSCWKDINIFISRGVWCWWRWMKLETNYWSGIHYSSLNYSEV